MPLTLPNLDDVTWAQFTEEARSLIPAYAPDWTNFNPSDPGITLVELLAYVTEQLLYRVNRIGDQQTIEYLRLLKGHPAWKPTKPLDVEKRAAVLRLRKLRRAVTEEDFEALALATNEQTKTVEHERVARAKCIAERNLEEQDAAARSSAAPGHVSVVVLAKRDAAPAAALLRRVKNALDAARLLTTRVHVVAPRLVTFSLRLTLVLQNRASPDLVRTAALDRLEDFFDPLRGGPDEKGWPFGRSVYVSEVYQLLSTIPGVDYATRSRDRTGREVDELMVGESEATRLKRNTRNELEALQLNADELVVLGIGPEDLTLQTK